MINFSLPTNGDRALSDQDDALLMKAATWLHSAIIPLSDLSEGADEDASELDTNVDEPGSIDELYHYITEKEKRTGPRFIWSYATGSEEYGGDKSLKDPWEKATIIAPYVVSDLIDRCFRPKVIGMSIKVLTRIWDHGSESDARAAFTTARIVCSRNYGTKAMAQEVRDAMETGRELGSHDLNSLQADNIQFKMFNGSYVHGTLTMFHHLKEDRLINEGYYSTDPKKRPSRERKDFDKLKDELTDDEILDKIWRPRIQDYNAKLETQATHYQVIYDLMQKVYCHHLMFVGELRRLEIAKETTRFRGSKDSSR